MGRLSLGLAWQLSHWPWSPVSSPRNSAARTRRHAPVMASIPAQALLLVVSKRRAWLVVTGIVYVGKVGTGSNRKSSMEIRKKLDAIVSSKSRLVKAPRLKGAS